MPPGATIILMHFLVHGDSTTHFMHAYPGLDVDAICVALPNLYCVSLMEIGSGTKRVAGGLFVKTHAHHADADFVSRMMSAAGDCPELAPAVACAATLAPSRLTDPDGGGAPSEEAMMAIVLEQILKRSAQGNA